MDTSLKIQMDIKNNVQDLQNYILDLNNWEKEMKKKEMELCKDSPVVHDVPPPRNKVKRNKPNSDKISSCKTKKKISAYDYSAWDKYDVDKACAELDDEEDKTENKQENEVLNTEQNFSASEETSSGDDDDNDDEDKLSLIDKAFYEKELGNQYVKKEQWDSAIKCYTNAINLDSKNAIYYANRSLCFLKLKNFQSAEVDATVAIQLDKSYVKAYQRRGYARLALGQLAEAKSDFEEVLQIEPRNSLMTLEINKISEKLKEGSKINEKTISKNTFNHKDIFKGNKKEVKKEDFLKESKSQKCMQNKTKGDSGDSVNLNSQNQKTFSKGANSADESTSVFEELPEHCRIIHPINIPPHKRSKKPLKRIDIIDLEDKENFTEIENDKLDEKITKLDSSCFRPSVNNIQSNDFEKTSVKSTEDQKICLEVPKTSVQFQNTWKIIKYRPAEAYNYLKNISGERLPQILENSLESDFFSDLLTFLASDQVEKDLDAVYSFLLSLSNVKRFSSLILFMSNRDKQCVIKCISELRKVKSEKEIVNLLELYELKLSQT